MNKLNNMMISPINDRRCKNTDNYIRLSHNKLNLKARM
jgi:hypothetical protein